MQSQPRFGDSVHPIEPGERIPFNRDGSAFDRQMSIGHVIRCGHPLKGYRILDEDGIYQLIRTCCSRISA